MLKSRRVEGSFGSIPQADYTTDEHPNSNAKPSSKDLNNAYPK
jgi:hypothetical protein